MSKKHRSTNNLRKKKNLLKTEINDLSLPGRGGAKSPPPLYGCWWPKKMREKKSNVRKKEKRKRNECKRLEDKKRRDGYIYTAVPCNGSATSGMG